MSDVAGDPGRPSEPREPVRLTVDTLLPVLRDAIRRLPRDTPVQRATAP